MKYKLLSFGVFLVIAAFWGCGTVDLSHRILHRNLDKFSTHSRYEHRKVTLTKSQRKKISQILDTQIPVEKVVKYFKAHKWKGMGVSGDIFVVSGESAYGPYRILVLIEGHSVSKLIQDKPIFKEGHLIINQEFLSQFVGRHLEQSFEIARTPEERLYTPTKIKPIANEMELSREIALKIKKALAVAVILKGKFGLGEGCLTP